MTPVAAPPPPPVQAPVSPSPPTLRVARRFGAPRPASQRAGVRVVALSVGVHLLLLVAAVTLLQIGRPSTGAQPAPPGATETSVTYIDVAPIAGEQPAQTEAATPGATGASAAPADTAGPRQPPPATPAGGVRPARSPAGGAQGAGAVSPNAGTSGVPGAGEPGGQGIADGALRPGYRDPRLYTVPRDPTPRPQTEHERYMAGLEGRIRSLNDSTAAEIERARKAKDWTTTDKDGNKWGVSPGKVHLGKVTIPVGNSGFGSPLDSMPGYSVRKSDEQWQREEIQRQAGDVERDQVAKDRIRATRERKDAERQKRKQGNP